MKHDLSKRIFLFSDFQCSKLFERCRPSLGLGNALPSMLLSFLPQYQPMNVLKLPGSLVPSCLPVY